MTSPAGHRHERYAALNRDARGSETDSFTPTRYRHLARHLADDVGAVLDLGCSVGRGGATLVARHPRVTLVGLDVVPERLGALGAAYRGGVCALADELPVADSSVRAVLAAELLEHLADADVDRLLDDVRRVLVPGGRFVATTPNPTYLRNRMTGRTVIGGSHLSEHHPRRLRRRLRDRGFRGVRVRGTGRVSGLVGQRFPWHSVYGSYLVVATRP